MQGILAYRGQVTRTLIAEPFVDVGVMENWARNDRGTLLFTGSGGSPVNFNVDTFNYRQAVRYSAGIKASDEKGRISAFVVGTLTDGKKIDAAQLSMGVRLNF